MYLRRGLFIIDPKGVLRQITMNDLPVGRSVEETLRLVQAFQYTDTHGEVCPAGWKPGGDTVSTASDHHERFTIRSLGRDDCDWYKHSSTQTPMERSALQTGSQSVIW